jgi:hypothetical protein
MRWSFVRQSLSRNSQLESIQSDANVRGLVGAVNCENIIETKMLWKKVPVLGEGTSGLKAATGGPLGSVLLRDRTII